jgi:hypothetical protein
MTRARLWQRCGHWCADAADWLTWLPATTPLRRLLMAAAIRAHVKHLALIRKAAS